jgi:hypothetical protein
VRVVRARLQETVARLAVHACTCFSRVYGCRVDSIAKLRGKLPALRAHIGSPAFFRPFFSWLFDFNKAKVGCVVADRSRRACARTLRCACSTSCWSPRLACSPPHPTSLTASTCGRLAQDQRVIQLDIAIDTIQIVMPKEHFPLVDELLAFLKVPTRSHRPVRTLGARTSFASLSSPVAAHAWLLRRAGCAAQTQTAALTKDSWTLLADFCLTVKPDLSNFDDDGEGSGRR